MRDFSRHLDRMSEKEQFEVHNPGTPKQESLQVDSVLAKSLRNENELLRFQLNEISARERHQRIELHRLRQQRDTEVSTLVHTATSKLKTELDHLKILLQTTNGKLEQAVYEKDHACAEKERAVVALADSKQSSTSHEKAIVERLRSLEDAFSKGSELATSVADSVEIFQRHVLPTFRSTNTDPTKHKTVHESGEARLLMEQLRRLETGIQLLRVIVDAKNDTLLLIRSKLKQENEEIRSELQAEREAKSKAPTVTQITPPHAVANEKERFEKNVLRQELLSLQNLFNAEVKQLKTKLKNYELEEEKAHRRLNELQTEVHTLQNKLTVVENSRTQAESTLKEETSARSQLVSQLFALRKENEMTKTELETLKLNQKFLVRQPRNGRIPPEKMDLMNTVNQLLTEMNKLKGDKVALEEELKAQRRSQVRDRVKRTITSRDIALAASNKVGDTELASKLARARLQQMGLQGAGRVGSPVSAAYDFGGASTPANAATMSKIDLATSSLLQGDLLEIPSRDDTGRFRICSQS